jgi:hypothetical protein
MELAVFVMDGVFLETLTVFIKQMMRLMWNEYLCTDAPMAKLFKFK